MSPAGNGGLGYAVGRGAVGLKGTGGVDNNVRLEGGDFACNIRRINIERDGQAAMLVTKGAGLGGAAPGNENLHIREAGEVFRQVSAEHAIATKDQDASIQ